MDCTSVAVVVVSGLRAEVGITDDDEWSGRSELEDTTGTEVVVWVTFLVETQRNFPCGNIVSLHFGSEKVKTSILT